MENASKALIIAGTILISILIIGIFVYVFRAGASMGETYDRKQLSEQLELYNSKFELYDVQDNTIMDLISLLNLAYSVNVDTNYDAENTVSIIINAEGKKISMPNTKGLQRNQVKIGSKTESIYSLATDTLDTLGIITGSTDTLAMTRYDSANNKTIYKYLFECDGRVSYNHSNGKVSSMEFNMYPNPDY